MHDLRDIREVEFQLHLISFVLDILAAG